MLTQGKEGAVELRELAGLLPSLAPSFTQFGKSGAEGLAELGAALQVIRGGFGSGSEAATGLNALMTALSRKADKFKEAGVELFEKDPETGAKKFRQFSKIIEDIGKSKLMNDPTALTDAFGSSEARRAFVELASNAGLFRDLFAKGLSSNAVNDDFVDYMESTSGRIEKAWQRLQNTLARELTPARVETLVSAFETLGRSVAWVVDHIRLFASVFAALKLAQWTARLYGLMNAMRGVGAAAGKAATSADSLGGSGAAAVGKFGKALGALSAFTIGYELGVALDNALGLSDALAGIEDTSIKAGKYDPEGKASKYRLYAKQGRDHADKLEKQLGRATTINGRRYASDGGVFRALPEDAEKTILLERKKAEEFELRAKAVEVIGRVRKLGRVNTDSIPEVGPVPEQTMRSIAEQTLLATGKSAHNPEVAAVMRAVVSELQRERRVEVHIQGQAVDAVLAYSNDIGRAPAP